MLVSDCMTNLPSHISSDDVLSIAYMFVYDCMTNLPSHISSDKILSIAYTILFHRIFCVSPPIVNFNKSQIQRAKRTHSVWALLITIVHIDLSIEWAVYRYFVTCGETTGMFPPDDFLLFSKTKTLPAVIYGSTGKLLDSVLCPHIIEDLTSP